jgi:uncharacterized lipoprotein YmbA
MKILMMLLASLALAGCGSPAAFNYTLSPPVSTATGSGVLSAPVPAKTVGPYALASVTVPPEADLSSLVVQQTDGRVLVLVNDLWTAPLSSHLRTALSLELTTRLGMPPIQNLVSGTSEAGVTRIQVDVQRFDMVAGQYVAIHALWRIRFAGSNKVLTCFTRLQQPVSIGVSALVTGQQKNTQLLSAQIAESLQTHANPAGAQCSNS